MPDAQLVRLASSVSERAAVSSRLDLYPRGMAAGRALKLAQASLFSAGELSEEQVRDRIAARFPEAEALPGRPQLDALLRDCGLPLRWDAQAAGGRGGYRGETDGVTATSGVATLERLDTAAPAPVITADMEDALRLEERLARLVSAGGFLVLTVAPREVSASERELLDRFPFRPVHLDGWLIAAMKECASEARADWKTVVAADAAGPHGSGWPTLKKLARRAVSLVKQRLDLETGPLLMLRPGLLVRYGLLDLLQHIQNRCLTSADEGGLKGAVLVLPADQQAGMPVIDGTVLPVTGPNQWTRVPEAWLRNAHRAGRAPDPPAPDAPTGRQPAL